MLFNTIEEILLPPAMHSLRFKSKLTGEEISKLSYLKELHQELKNQMMTTLEGIQTKYKDIPNLTIKIEVVVEYPPESITKKYDCEFELLVMGTLGLRGIFKLHVIGSVAKKYLKLVHVMCY